MPGLLEITGADIAQLGDDELRELIGLLCEADYRSTGLPTKGITWGGHQDASDGGFDVMVRASEDPPATSFIPRKATGFQVKKPDMPPAKIRDEMCPKGVLRNGIRSLTQEGGAYIIISSTGSTTGTALKSRKDAMREAVAHEPNQQNLYLDFLDCGRVATWVRLHPSLILWIRNKIGRPLRGWWPYENWANAPGGIDEEYLLDDGLRLFDGTRPSDEGISAEDGLLRLRTTLSEPGNSVRLAGLSGVGKTRLVQALFDERIGAQALNRSLAFYTDISYGPEPDPITFAEQLIASRTRAILVVDNCPPELHRRLTHTCSGIQSTVSLLTVEYDVRDDLPDETSVFRLEPASEELIEKLIQKRFEHISEVDTRTIAIFSGGNARLAIALATTVQYGETLSGFRDEELFERLFKQRNDPSESLLYSAEVCSLVYSFDGKDTTSETSELKFLASLLGKTASELFRDVSTLKARDLIQSRHIWRAVLPHAIANRLARRALESIPKDTLIDAFIHRGSERLITSFTRRLGFLHDCEAAIDIVTDWLTPTGWLGKENGNFNNFGMEVFRNIAPVVPEKTLEAIERAANGEDGHQFTSRENAYYDEFVRLLRHLAYEPELFARSVKIMCRYALSEKPEENNNSTRNVLQSLFHIKLSGTHASVEARAAIIKELASAEDHESQELGILLLDATLETWHFMAAHDFDFGARPRDYGFMPQSRQDIITWFGTFIALCTDLAISNRPIATQARKTLSKNLRGLWTNVRILDELETSAKRIHEHTFWSEGWPAARSIIRYDSKGFDKETLERLQNLEQLLKPTDLLSRARMYALSDQRSTFELEEDCEEGDATSHRIRVEHTTCEIGVQVARDAEILATLLLDIVSTYNPRLDSFGKGLAAGCSDKQELWQALYAQFEKTPLEKRQIGVLLGFFSECSESEPALYHSIMDSLIDDNVLGRWFPIFQINSVLDQRGLKRLHHALDVGIASTYTYEQLAWGRRHEAVNDDELANLIQKIITKDSGIYVAVKLLHMRFHGTATEPANHSNSLIATGRDVLIAYPFSDRKKRHNSSDYALARIADVCLKNAEGRDPAIVLCNHLADALANYHIYASDYFDLLNVLARLQPTGLLDSFLGSYDIRKQRHRRLFLHDSDLHPDPLNQISEATLIGWCEADPEQRYPALAATIDTHFTSIETGRLEWKPIIYVILEKAPDLRAILNQLTTVAHPTSWSGSRADLLQKRSALYQNLENHINEEIRAWAKSQFLQLQETIRHERESEEKWNREHNERFE